MKQIFCKSAIFLLFALALLPARAQHSLDLRWGYLSPVNGRMQDAFHPDHAFSIGFLHPFKNERLAAGLSFSHQQYQSEAGYFVGISGAQLKVQNYLLTLRYDLVKTSQWRLYSSVDAGLNQIRLKSFGGSHAASQSASGFSTGLAFGVDLQVSPRVLLGVNLQGLYSCNNTLVMEQGYRVSGLTAVGGNLGCRFLLDHRRH